MHNDTDYDQKFLAPLYINVHKNLKKSKQSYPMLTQCSASISLSVFIRVHPCSSVFIRGQCSSVAGVYHGTEKMAESRISAFFFGLGAFRQGWPDFENLFVFDVNRSVFNATRLADKFGLRH